MRVIDHGLALHRLLFPIGPRQEAALLRSAPETPPEQTFLAIHRGIAAGIDIRARTLRASAKVRAWIRLDAEPAAAEMLWASSPDEQITKTIKRGYGRPDSDLGEAYAGALSPDLRHRLGEHYTPSWLVRQMATVFAGGGVTADPACGDGRFLVAMLDAGHPPDDLWGADLNPLAVMMARLNVWRRLGCPARPPAMPVIWGDFVLGHRDIEVPPELRGAAVNVAAMPVPKAYIGNPPWIAWRNLSAGYRAAVAAHLCNSRLNHARGWAARVSIASTDLAHVFLHDAVERLDACGRLGFVLPRSVFTAPVGPGQVRGGIATSGRPYRFTGVWDFAHSDPFSGVRLDAVVAFVTVDQASEFPVPWQTSSGGHAVLSDPADATSPWLTPDLDGNRRPAQLVGGERWIGLRGRGGINTGGGNSAFYVDVLSETGSTVVIRSLPSRRTGLDAVVAEVERGLVRPLLRGKDVRAWIAEPSCHVLLPHRADDLRKPTPEAELARDAPKAYTYLTGFKELLADRKELRRWPATSWYALFRIGPYTAGCWRVVWPHSGNAQLRAAVLAPDNPAVPDQKVVLVAFEERAPAMFLAALLNSSVVRAAASASAGMDASPNLVRRLILPRFAPERVDHRQIVALAQEATNGVANDTDIDRAVGVLYD